MFNFIKSSFLLVISLERMFQAYFVTPKEDNCVHYVSFSRLRRSDFRSFRELKILSTLHCVGGKANIRSATSLRSWGYNSLTTRCRSVGLRFNCFMMVSEFSFKICKLCFTIVLNISILADISKLIFIKKQCFYMKILYYVLKYPEYSGDTLRGL